MTIVTYPERVASYLSNKTAGKRLPFSCTLATLEGGTVISEIMKFASISLKAGAGVKLVIKSDFKLPDPRKLDYVMMSPDSELAKTDEYDFVPSSNYVTSVPEGYTSIVVGDSMADISASWLEFERLVSEGAKVCLDLRNIRPMGTVNSDGLVASGPVSFGFIIDTFADYLRAPSMFTLLRLFGVLNAVILKGGYKKGIITSAIYDTSEYYEEYLNVPLVSLRGSHKKGVILTKEPKGDMLATLCDKVNTESLFLQKHQEGDIYANVCQGIYLKDRGTCLIYRLNLGMVDRVWDIIPAMMEATKLAIKTHVEWRKLHPSQANNWASVETDNQVAVDVMGFANLLANNNVTYEDIDAALKDEECTPKAKHIVNVLRAAYQMSSQMADYLCTRVYSIPCFDRLHTVEPAQSHSYRCVDRNGYTVSRGIWPPFSRRVNRVSNSQSEEVKTYDFGDCEVRISPDLHFSVCNRFMALMQEYGRPHAMSYDTWKDFDPDVFSEWYLSNLGTLYYNVSKDYHIEDYSRKVIKPITLCPSCTD